MFLGIGPNQLMCQDDVVYNFPVWDESCLSFTNHTSYNLLHSRSKYLRDYLVEDGATSNGPKLFYSHSSSHFWNQSDCCAIYAFVKLRASKELKDSYSYFRVNDVPGLFEKVCIIAINDWSLIIINAPKGIINLLCSHILD